MGVLHKTILDEVGNAKGRCYLVPHFGGMALGYELRFAGWRGDTMGETHENILLIEDSPSQALRFQLLLHHAGYEVRLATDGRQGWNEAHDHHPALILLDLNLPQMSGLQVLSRLKRDRATACIPVVMLSDQDSIASVERALELGAQDYLFKSDYAQADSVGHLHDAIKQVLHHEEDVPIAAICN